MATNKHAIIRYHALDQCFSNPGRKYFMDDLILACNNALNEYTGLSEGVKRRQIFEDIKFMESEQGWNISLERPKDGKQVYYRYTDRSFSIRNQPVNESDANQLRETLSILSRFKGMPQFEWMEELMVRIESSFNLKDNTKVIVGFEQNPYLKGLHFFSDIFNAIHYNVVLQVTYKGFRQPNPVQMIVHPYYLKQYNNRWFLFGYNEELETISNLALDRIVELNELTTVFKTNEEINFEDYFEDLVGVTVRADAEVNIVQIQVDRLLWPYIESKPIHGSQKVLSRSENHVIIQLQVKINYELISLLFSYGEGLIVLEPSSLRQHIKNQAETLLNNYL